MSTGELARRVGSAALLAVFLLLAVGSTDSGGTGGGSSSNSAGSEDATGDTFSAPEVSPEDETSTPIPTYEIVDRDTHDAPIKTQVEIHAVVSGTVTEPGLRALLKRLYGEARAMRGFTYHGGRPHTYSFIFIPLGRIFSPALGTG